MDLNELLSQLQQDFAVCAEIFERLTIEILNAKVTRYPVFVACDQPVNLGLPIINREDYNLHWNYRVSPLEELTNKNVMDAAQAADFKRAFFDPLDKACLLFILPNGAAHFVFIPYDEVG